MKLDVGYTVYSLDDASFLYGFSSLIDYDPNSSDLDDAVGEHFKIYKTANNSHLLFYKIRGQESLGSPAFTASEGIIPISNDLAFLLMNRDTRDVSINDTKKHYDALITDLTAWVTEIEPKIDAVFELSQDFKNNLNEMLVCLNANAFRSCLAMAGIVLERLLKNFLTVKNIPHPKNSMVGDLISQIEHSGQHLDPSLKNIWNLINAQRIIGVHAKDKTPIPSRDQAIMVIFAVKDTVTRMLSA